jgi:hypothetical protein
MKRCSQNQNRIERHRVNLALPSDLWENFQPALKKYWKGSFTSWVVFAMTCYSRESCEGCPYNKPGSNKEKGIGKVFNREI